MIVAIGDSHGELGKVDALLARFTAYGINFTRDTLVWLGDYCDGGPDTAPLVTKLIAFEQQYPHWVFLRGNHEQMLLDALAEPRYFDHWWYQGGRETFESYRDSMGLSPYERSIVQPEQAIPPAHRAWFEARPYFYETEHFLFVHAGFVPNIPLDANPLSAMLWIRHDFINSTYKWGRRVIFGHTASQVPVVMPNKIGIDCMRHGKGPLTAVVLDEERPEWYHFITSE